MTKKLTIGATVALCALALATGPASAHPASSPDDFETAQQVDVVFDEVGVDLDTTISGSVIELHNLGSAGSLDGYTLVGCDGTFSFTIRAFDIASSFPASGFFLVADNVYDSGGGTPRDAAFNSGVDLDQSDGGVALLDPGFNVVGSVRWGTPATQCAGFTDAGDTPDDDNSLHFNTTPPPPWCKLPPALGQTESC